MIGWCALALIYLLIWGYAARGAWSLGPMGLSWWLPATNSKSVFREGIPGVEREPEGERALALATLQKLSITKSGPEKSGRARDSAHRPFPSLGTRAL